MIFRILTFPFRYSFSKLKKAIGKLNRVKIEPLYAFGNEDTIFVKGRAIEAYKQSKPSPKKNPLQNILGTIRRYAGSSIVDAKIDVVYQDKTQPVISDGEGIFDATFQNINTHISKKEYVIVKLHSESGLKPVKEFSQVPVRRYSSGHPLGIISDIDDTVLISHATQIGKKFWLSISKNAYTRRPFPGVSELYEILTDSGRNPVFYVSSSDWGLNDLIRDFLKYRKLPEGPLLLKDLHINLKNVWKSGGGSHTHKEEKIQMLFDLYSDMKFVLIGDSGQHDPEIYATLIKRNPGRVLTVYIRQIKDNDPQRKAAMEEMISPVEPPEILFVENTQEAIDHAKRQRSIQSE
ncbi:MAG TPA: phosphatase domain-containing protein [Cyclobacteriaceae bacterium]|nr:phosphatase domain-containing protein [Cyclobacteriaceae bacterium]